MVCLDLVVCLNFEQENQGEKKNSKMMNFGWGGDNGFIEVWYVW